MRASAHLLLLIHLFPAIQSVSTSLLSHHPVVSSYSLEYIPRRALVMSHPWTFFLCFSKREEVNRVAIRQVMEERLPPNLQ